MDEPPAWLDVWGQQEYVALKKKKNHELAKAQASTFYLKGV